MTTPQAVKAIKERRERREDMARVMEAMNEDWKPRMVDLMSDRPNEIVHLSSPLGAGMVRMHPGKWWKV